MARLIEFFTKTGELVLDPFAGVGGTLLGAAIARGPRRALGFELEPRWAEVYDEVVARRAGGARRRRAAARRPRAVRPGRRPRRSTRRAARCASAMRSRSCRTWPTGSVDFVATDPPYNIQLTLTMAGGKLAETHANRRTDYAMVTDDPADLANSADYAAFLDRMDGVLGECGGSCDRAATPRSSCATPTRTAATVFTGADLAARAATVGLVPKGDLIWYQAGTRLRPYGYPTPSCRTSPTSTSWCSAANAHPALAGAPRPVQSPTRASGALRPSRQVGRQDVPSIRPDRHRPHHRRRRCHRGPSDGASLPGRPGRDQR